MRLWDNAKKLCKIVLPCGTYYHNKLPMVLCIATDIFQARLWLTFVAMENVVIYIDDILVVIYMSFEEHLEVLDKIKSGIHL